MIQKFSSCRAPCVLFVANRGYALRSSRESIIQHFIKNGYCVILATEVDSDSRYLESLGAVVEHVNFSRGGLSPWLDMRALLRLKQIINRYRPTLIHNFHAKPVILASLIGRYLLSGEVVIINTITGLGHAFVKGGIISQVAGMGYSLACPRSNCTVFQNKDDKSLFIRKNWVDEKRAMLIIGSGVNLTQFTPNFQPIEESRPIQIVMLGRLIWHKGMYEFSQVAEHIRRLHPDVRLVWAGELDLDHPDAVPEQWLSSQTNFDYLGRVSDVPELLRRSDILLFPSVYREGVPRSVMEAAATKIPCVGFDVPGVREAVRHEITGYLVAEGDIDGLTKAVLSMLSDSELRTQMGEQARFLAENEFDINKISADYVQTYRDFGIDIPAFG